MKIGRPLFVLIILIFSSGFVMSTKAQVVKGLMVKEEICTADSNQTYAYYLPSYYTTSHRWPAIFIFEPLARGTVGASVYKQVAEQYGYLVFCSNNSRNGPTEIMIEAGNAMYADAMDKFLIDKDLCIVSGFSGGSRISLFLALNSSVFDAVIGCGAGLPNDYELNHPFDVKYYGIVGDVDFNYAEMMDVERLFEEYGIIHRIAVFEGPHIWPSETEIELAILWIELEQMKMGQIDLDNSRIERYDAMMDSLEATYRVNGNYILQERIVKNWKAGLNGLMDTKKLTTRHSELLQNEKKSAQLAHHDQTLKMEADEIDLLRNSFQAIYYPMFGKKDLRWWENKMKYLRQMESSNDHITSLAGKRLLGAISVNAYFDSEFMFDTKQYDKAQEFIRIWLMSDPRSLYANYFLAKVLIEQGNKKKAVKQLYTCRELGMKDYTRLLSDTTFNKLSGYKKFDQLIIEMDTLQQSNY